MGKILTLGESLARMTSPFGQRLMNSTSLQLHYGGAEANVAMNLAMLDHDVEYATKLPLNNSLAENSMIQLYGKRVNCDKVIYGQGRLGSYYVEVGTGLRPSNVIYDRKYSAISMMERNEWDLDQLFSDVSVFHITGITVALSDFWHEFGVELVQAAKERGIKVSFDMNYRSTMWTYDEAIPAYQAILPYVDYLSASQRDAIAFFGIDEVEGQDERFYLDALAEKYPNLNYIFGTHRHAITPNSFEMIGYLYNCQTHTMYMSGEYDLETIVDRVGSGDSYTAGILDGILLEKEDANIPEFAMAAAALQHTIYGDINLFRRNEIERFMSNSENVLR